MHRQTSTLGSKNMTRQQWRQNEYERGRGGAHLRRKVPDNLLLLCPSTLLALQIQLVVLVSAFVMVSTVWSVSCLLFFYSRCPPCPAFCKIWRGGGTCRPVSYGVGATVRQSRHHNTTTKNNIIYKRLKHIFILEVLSAQHTSLATTIFNSCCQ